MIKSTTESIINFKKIPNEYENISNTNNDNIQNIPLIERILVIGLTDDQVKKQSANQVNMNNVNFKILEEYKYNNLNEHKNEKYLENISTFCMPEGVKVLEEITYNNCKSSIHSFSLLTNNSKRKHCSCLTFYEQYKCKDINVNLYASKCICLVSSKAIYNTHSEILNNIFSILLNYKLNNQDSPEKLKYVYLKKKSYTVLKEYKILDFYFSFLVNSLKYSKLEQSYYLNYIGNNTGQKCFAKYHSNNKCGYPLTNFDMTILLDKFNIEDLIKLYLGLLMEYKIILIFDDYSEINLIIFSLISLLYPLKWNFPIISFITKGLMETIDAPFAIIIGIHSKFINLITLKINQKESFSEETLIYNLPKKTFISIPTENILLPQLPLKIINELRSNIYLLLSEKLSLTSEIESDDTELNRMFNVENIFPRGDSFKYSNSKNHINDLEKMNHTNILKLINPTSFLNLKFIQIFLNVFLELIKNLESSIYFSKIKSIINSKLPLSLLEVFDTNKFINDREYHNDKSFLFFLEQFSKSLMFLQFLEKYIKNSDKNPKYMFIKKMIFYLTSRENGKILLKNFNREYIKNKLISFYNFKFLSLEEALKKWLLDYTSNNSPTQYSVPDKLWTCLINYKNFSVNSDNFCIKDNDEKLKENQYKQLYNHLIKFKQYKQYEVDNCEEDVIQSININETKMKELFDDNMNTYTTNTFNYSSNENFSPKLKSSINYSILNTRNCRPTYHKHKISTSFKLEENNIKDYNTVTSNVMKNNANFVLPNIIKCDNNIENIIVNNINISSDDKNKNFPIESKTMKSNNTKLFKKINLIKSLHSCNNSMNENYNFLPISTFISENFTSRHIETESNDVSQSKKFSQSKINISDSKKKKFDLSDLIHTTSRNRNSSINKHYDNFYSGSFIENIKGNIDTNSNSNYIAIDDVKISKISLKDESTEISPFKKIKLMNDSSNNRAGLRASLINSNINLYLKNKLKNSENIHKLAGDEELYFSEGEDP